jgi:hypothetical protein
MTVHSRRLIVDGLNVAWLALAGIAAMSFYFAAGLINTNYPDWMYHAFRAQSIMQHGLLSWDNIWDNGISYWRGYQVLPALITAAIAKLSDVSAPRAMVLLTIGLFAAFHVLVYVCIRATKRAPLVSAIIATLSFAFTGFWVLVGFYSILYAVVLVPPLIVLWYYADTKPLLRVVFATCIGLCTYIHPLLAIGMGLLWLVNAVANKGKITKPQLLIELYVVLAVSFFYWFGLVFVDTAYVAPYQLAKDFLFTVSVASKYGYVYWLITPVVAFTAIFASWVLSTKSKYLFWISALLFIVIMVNRFTPIIDFLNRYQVYRLNFFIAIALLFPFAEVLTKFVGWAPRTVTYALLGLILGLSLTQTLIDGSVYGFSPANSVPDPVTAYLNTHHSASDGSIYINNSMPSSYDHPSLRFSNGYNDQLLPQLMNDRMRSLLSQTSPNYEVSESQLATIAAYDKVLGIGYLFLPHNSPYVGPLTSNGSFKLSVRLTSNDYDLVVLVPTWQVRNAFTLSPSQKNLIQSSQLPGTYAASDSSYYQLDSAVSELAAIEYSPNTSAVPLVFPAPDKIALTLPSSGSNSLVFINQSYSKAWMTARDIKISKTPEGMMVLTAKQSVSTISLRHTWGPVPVIQGILFATVLVLIGFMLAKERSNV